MEATIAADIRGLPGFLDQAIALLNIFESASNERLAPFRSEIADLKYRIDEIIKPGWRLLQLLPITRQPTQENYEAFSAQLAELARDISALAEAIEPSLKTD